MENKTIIVKLEEIKQFGGQDFYEMEIFDKKSTYTDSLSDIRTYYITSLLNCNDKKEFIQAMNNNNNLFKNNIVDVHTNYLTDTIVLIELEFATKTIKEEILNQYNKILNSDTIKSKALNKIKNLLIDFYNNNDNELITLVAKVIDDNNKNQNITKLYDEIINKIEKKC